MTIRFLADENFDHKTLAGLLRRDPSVDIVAVQDVGLREADDPTVLDWAAREGRILVTHDVSTMAGLALERVLDGLPMPGVFEIPEAVPKVAIPARSRSDSGIGRGAQCPRSTISGTFVSWRLAS